jgi:hypothetical protein
LIQDILHMDEQAASPPTWGGHSGTTVDPLAVLPVKTAVD